jgi:hypothetical protein
MPTEITGGRVLAGLVAWRFEVGHDGRAVPTARSTVSSETLATAGGIYSPLS